MVQPDTDNIILLKVDSTVRRVAGNGNDGNLSRILNRCSSDCLLKRHVIVAYSC